MKDPEPIQMPWNSRGFLAGEAGSRRSEATLPAVSVWFHDHSGSAIRAS
jgi:hypothetical protein